MKSKDLVTVYTLADPVKAEIMKNALEKEGIRCFLEGVNRATTGLALATFGLDIQVPAKQAARARKFIRAHEKKSSASEG